MINSSHHAMVLVVDDDVLARMGASDMFLDAGYEVLDAGSADEALRFFETGSDIRLLFTDVSMPGCVSSEGWHVQQETNLPGQKSGAP